MAETQLKGSALLRARRRFTSGQRRQAQRLLDYDHMTDRIAAHGGDINNEEIAAAIGLYTVSLYGLSI